MCWSSALDRNVAHVARVAQVDEANKALQFVSISSDGNVNLWTLTKSELVPENLMKLRVVKAGDAFEDDPMANGPAGGCCMDFCKVRKLRGSKSCVMQPPSASCTCENCFQHYLHISHLGNLHTSLRG